jgi:hypothetical protein
VGKIREAEPAQSPSNSLVIKQADSSFLCHSGIHDEIKRSTGRGQEPAKSPQKIKRAMGRGEAQDFRLNF